MGKVKSWCPKRQRRKDHPSTHVSSWSSSPASTTWATARLFVNSVKERQSLLSCPITPHNSAAPRSSTTLCWPRPVSITTRETTLSSVPLAVSYSNFTESEIIESEMALSLY